MFEGNHLLPGPMLKKYSHPKGAYICLPQHPAKRLDLESLINGVFKESNELEVLHFAKRERKNQSLAARMKSTCIRQSFQGEDSTTSTNDNVHSLFRVNFHIYSCLERWS